MKMEIDHIGYAVKDINTAIAAFEKIGYTFGISITDEMRHVMASIGTLGSFKIELISPMGEKSPVDNYLKKLGNTPYHICYKVDDINMAINTLKAQNFLLVLPPDFYKLLSGEAAFMFSVETGLIELVQYGIEG